MRNAAWPLPSGATMPFSWKRTIATSESPIYEFTSWIPNLIIINLGTNDFNALLPPSESDFVETYIKLIK